MIKGNACASTDGPAKTAHHPVSPTATPCANNAPVLPLPSALIAWPMPSSAATHVTAQISGAAVTAASGWALAIKNAPGAVQDPMTQNAEAAPYTPR